MIFYTVAFNKPEFIDIQKKYLPGKLVVVNNGKNSLIKSKCESLDIPCHEIENHESSPSKSHGNALNFLKNIIDYTEDYCILDHDFVVYKKINFFQNDIVTSKCVNGNVIHMWPGFIAAKNYVNIREIDFLPNHNGDTGVNTQQLFSKYSILFTNNEYLEKYNLPGLPQQRIIVEKFSDFGIHFLNGSLWLPDINNVYLEKIKYFDDIILRHTQN